jgi:hypothetical protein
VIYIAAGHQLKDGAYIEKLGLAAMNLNKAPCLIFTGDIHSDYLSDPSRSIFAAIRAKGR